MKSGFRNGMLRMNATAVALRGLIFVSIATISGCTSTKTQLDVAYVPQRGNLSPLSTIKPLALAVQVDDQRDTTVRDRVGNMPGFATSTAVYTNGTVTLLLRDALLSELENNGHHARSAKDMGVNATVRFALKTYWCCDIRVLETRYWVATIGGNLEVLDARKEKVLSKPVGSTYIKTIEYNIPEFEIMINGVLSEFVRNFARDPDVVNALRRIQRGQTDSSAKERFASFGADAFNTPEQLGTFIQKHFAKWTKVVKGTNVQVD